MSAAAVLLASSPGHSQLFNVSHFSVCNVEKLGVAWGRGYSATVTSIKNMLVSIMAWFLYSLSKKLVFMPVTRAWGEGGGHGWQSQRLPSSSFCKLLNGLRYSLLFHYNLNIMILYIVKTSMAIFKGDSLGTPNKMYMTVVSDRNYTDYLS